MRKLDLARRVLCEVLLRIKGKDRIPIAGIPAPNSLFCTLQSAFLLKGAHIYSLLDSPTKCTLAF